MIDARQEHWNRVYREKPEERLSWHQETPQPSLDAFARCGIGPDHSVIDIGGGISSLAQCLLERGWRDVTVLDISETALAAAKKRLGARGGEVCWKVADICAWTPERRFDAWHDRAVFHFLTEPAQRAAYRTALLQGLAPGGWAIIATFALDGPEKCSGLPVKRYDAASLARELGADFALEADWREEHITPWGDPQSFQWCALRKR